MAASERSGNEKTVDPKLLELLACPLTKGPLSWDPDRSELVSILMNVTIREWEQQFDHHGKGETTLAEEIDDHLVWDE